MEREGAFRFVRLGISGVALALSMGEWIELPWGLDFAWLAVLLCGVPIVLEALRGVLIDHDIKADVLVAIALLSSLVLKEFFAAGEVAFIMEIGEALEDITSEKAKKGIEKLVKLLPQTARVRRDGEEIMIPISEIEVNDHVIVLAGETIPVDGVIYTGETMIDQAAMTGESIPVEKKVGDKVMSGSINQYQVFEMIATTKNENSALQRMVRLAKEAEEKKAPIVEAADRWATWIVIAAFVSALLALGINYLITSSLQVASLRAVTVLIVFCPCAFVLATPTAILAGIALAAKHGMIVKSGEALQRFATVTHVACDKTGTLTLGKMRVVAVESDNPAVARESILHLAASVEAHSEHPLGKAIVDFARQKGCPIANCDSVIVEAGQGISALYEGKQIFVGKETFIRNQGVVFDSLVGKKYSCRGATVIYIAAKGQLLGCIALADELKEDAPNTIQQLKQLDVQPILLTGDHDEVASTIAKKAGIDEYYAEFLPEEKQKLILDKQAEGKKLCMIGDGINDALALSSAHAAIAMGGIGSDVAMEASDVVFVNDDIKNLPYLLELSRRVLKKIQTNLGISIVINIIATILAATGILNPVVGALVHNVGSVFVVVNSVLILWESQKK